MKTTNVCWFKRLIALTIFPLVAATGFAQGSIIFPGPEVPTVLPTVRIEAADAGASEYGPSTGLFWIWREGGNTNLPLTVSVRFGGTATPQVDYLVDPATHIGLPEGRSASITIPARAVRAALPIIPVDDQIAEGSETVVATIQLPVLILAPGQTVSLLPGYVVGRSSTATVTISDDDTGFVSLPTVSIAVDDSRASETERNPGTFRVTRIGDRDHELRVNYSVGGNLITGPNDANADPAGPFQLINAATNGEDFDRLPGFIIIPAGAASATIVIRPINDQIPEGAEAVVIKLIAASTYSINAPEQASIIIEDNDDPLIDLPPSIEVFASDPDAKEPLTLIDALPGGITIVPSRETATFTFVRTGRTDIQLRIEYQLSGTASNGVDFIRLPGVLEMPSGARTATVTITPLPDTFSEGTETVVLTVVAPICPAIFPPPPWCYSVGKTNSATASIADADITIPSTATVTVIASDPEAAERRLSGNRVDSGRFTVRRTGSVALPLLVFFEIGGTASTGVDYVRLPGTVTIPSSREAVEIEVSPIDDDLVELPETVTLTLVASPALSPLPSYNVGAPNQATVTIVDDEQPRPTAGKLLNINFGSGAKKVGPAVTGKSPDDVWNVYEYPYAPLVGPLNLVWADGASSGISLAVTNAGGQWYNISGDAMYDSYVYPNSGRGDGEGNIELGLYRVPAGVYDLYLYGKADPTGQGGGARPESDTMFTVLSGGKKYGPTGTHTNAGWKVSQGWREGREFVLFREVTVAADGSLVITASPGFNGEPWPDGPARPAVINGLQLVARDQPDNQRPTVTVSAPDAEAVESRSGTSTNTGTFRFSRTGDLSRSLEVFYQMSGIARNGTDYVELDGDATIAAGSAVRDIFVQPRADNRVEEPETVVLTLRSNEGYTVGQPAVATVRILETSTPSNRPPTIVINSPTNGASFAAPARIEIKATAIDPQSYISRVEFFDGDRRIGVSEIVFIRAPDPGTPIDHTFVWTNVAVGQHTLTVRAQVGNGNLVVSSPVRVSVVEKPNLPTVTVTSPDAEVVETRSGTPTNTGTFRFSRSGDLSRSLEVFYQMSGIARNGTDYVELDGDATIAAGSAVRDIFVQPRADNLVEETETVVLTLRPDSSYTVGQPAVATVRILETSTPSNRPPSIVINSPADGTSFAAPARIEIKATAIDPQSYISRVEFFDGDRRIGVSEIIFVRAPDPGTPIEHTFVWTNVTVGQYRLTARARVRDVTTTSAAVRVSVADVSALPVVNLNAVTLVGFEEGTNNAATFRVTRTGSVSAPLEVLYTVGGTASNGSDYRELTGRIAIPVGADSAVIAVAPLSDKALEFIESIIVTLQAPECAALVPSPAGCYRVGTSARATVYIIDGGLPPFPNAARSGLPVLAGLVEVEHHTDGQCRLRAVGQPGLNVAIEASTDLKTWTSLANVSLVDGVADFTDANAAEAPRRFYRVRPTSVEK